MSPDDFAAKNARTRFISRVMRVDMVPRLLVSGHNNGKIGKTVLKGPWRCMPIYTLTLEERATCPRSCSHWLTCYGNHMHWPRRIAHGIEFEKALIGECMALAKKHPYGYVVRLHVLGDFYSVDYVKLWGLLLAKIPQLRIFGYTARQPGTEIGDEIERQFGGMWKRVAMRYSDSYPQIRSTVTVSHGQSVPEGAILCPAQVDDRLFCGRCGLCWHTEKPIAFLQH